MGSFFLVEAETEEQARAFMAGDPYISSGMYESITVNHIVPACGAMLGGVIWDQDEIRANLPKYNQSGLRKVRPALMGLERPARSEDKSA